MTYLIWRFTHFLYLVAFNNISMKQDPGANDADFDSIMDNSKSVCHSELPKVLHGTLSLIS